MIPEDRRAPFLDNLDQVAERFKRIIVKPESLEGGIEGQLNTPDNLRLLKELSQRKPDSRSERTCLDFFMEFMRETARLIEQCREEIQGDRGMISRAQNLLSDLETRITALEFFFQLNRSVVDYQPTSPKLFHLNPVHLSEWCNAFLYHRGSQDIRLNNGANNERLQGIPGRVELLLRVHNEKLRVKLVIRPTEVHSPDNKPVVKLWASILSGRPQEHLFDGDRLDGSRISEITEALSMQTSLKAAIGNVQFRDHRTQGYKPSQNHRVFLAFEDFSEQASKLFRDNVRVEKKYRPDQREDLEIVVRIGKSSYSLRYGDPAPFGQRVFGDEERDLQNCIVFERQDVFNDWKITSDENQLGEDLEKEMAVLEQFLAFFYQRAGVPYPSQEICLVPPGAELLRELKELHIMSEAPRDLDPLETLGARQSEIARIMPLLEEFKKSSRGEAAIKPSHLILYGESGIGKTALESGMISSLQKMRIDTYVLDGVAVLECAGSDQYRPKILEGLRNVFFYLKIHGGVLLINDLDAMLGVRPGAEMDAAYRAQLQMLFHAEVEALRDHPQVWLLANTEWITAFQGALTQNERRFGQQIGLERDKHPDAIVGILEKALHQIHLQELRQAVPQEGLEAFYGINLTRIAVEISEACPEGFTPSQIRAGVSAWLTYDERSQPDHLRDRLIRIQREHAQLKRERLEFQGQTTPERIQRIEEAVQGVQSTMHGIIQSADGAKSFALGAAVDSKKATEGVVRVEAKLTNLLAALEKLTPQLADIQARLGRQELELQEIKKKLSESETESSH